MKKKLSVIVGLAMVLSMGSTCFAEASSAEVPADTTAAVGTSDTTSTTLTLDQVLSSIEKNNMEINMYDQKILLYQRQFDRDHQNAMLNADKSPVNYPAGQYAAVKIAIDVVPKRMNRISKMPSMTGMIHCRI